MQSSGYATVRQWPTLSFTPRTCKLDLVSEFIRWEKEDPPPPRPPTEKTEALRETETGGAGKAPRLNTRWSRGHTDPCHQGLPSISEDCVCKGAVQGAATTVKTDRRQTCGVRRLWSPAKSVAVGMGTVGTSVYLVACRHPQRVRLPGARPARARRVRHPNECSGHLSRYFTPKHDSLLEPRNPKHKETV